MDTTLFIVGHNDPGFMPDAEPQPAPTWAQAKAMLIEEIERDLEDAEQLADLSTGAQKAMAQQRVGELQRTVHAVRAWREPQHLHQDSSEMSIRAAGEVWWIHAEFRV